MTHRLLPAILVCWGLSCAGADPGDAPAPAPAEPFVEALPEAALLALSVPAPAQGHEPARPLSALYVATRDTARGINQGLDAVITPIETIVADVPPHHVEDDTAMWWGQQGGVDNLLVVRREDDGHFEYTTLTRPTGAPRAAWRPVIHGTHTPSADAGRGQGVVWVNMDHDNDENTAGTVMALFSNVGPERTLTVYFFEASGNLAAEPPRSSAYHFQEALDAGPGEARGTLVYAVRGVDVHANDPERDALEDVAIITRWTGAGGGRSDLYATGGDVEAEGYEVSLYSECWAAPDFATDFAALWVRQPDGTAFALGAEGELSACAFAEPGQPVIPELPSAPEDPALPPEAPQ